LKIILLSILLTGCSIPDYEYKTTCDDFNTGWIGLSDGFLLYATKSGGYAKYRVKYGETCIRERRVIYEQIP